MTKRLFFGGLFMSKKKTMDKGKKKKIILTVLCSLLVVFAAAAGVLFHEYKKDYTCKEQNGFSMGSVVTVRLYGDDTFKKLSVVKGIIDNLDKEISRNREDSAVSKLNENGTAESAGAAAIFTECRKVSELSNGAFDLTVGPVSSLWNFDGDLRKVPEKSELEKALGVVDYEKVEVNGSTLRVAEGQQLDLGAVGKGAACDAVSDYIKNCGAKGGVVSVGGSIFAWGKRNRAGDKWRIAVRHPRQENAYIGVIQLSEGFVSTSGDYEKYFEKDSKRYHHILDANTGYPAESGLVSVTVVCDSGALSDALSTACFILGEEKSKALLSEFSAGAVFVDSELNVTTYGEIDFEKTA